ncbi:hypothetical protein [Paraglaciecola arctica]|uniref:Gamma-glutamylcyclotransferase AIG2-like domain-containing protein n=1 Tax=Paraglaciecola arctica BSs20135 TaxID=493475 RepID=K6YLJ9_9ALTE|nr:hypothetical protein [Paraglaciecola arctica]GAC19042.1 hypothetical protein GARC_2075 [Paraglaciecola arctica BSs20135]
MSVRQKHYLVGYGSLLSHDSRSRYSNIFCPNLPIIAHGWRREWLARGLEDLQTCLGVSHDVSSHLNGVLLPIEQISPELRNREQDYQFIEVDYSRIEAAQESPLVQVELDKIRANPNNHKIWICANQHKIPANIHYPIYQTYLDTCLVGCFDMGIENFAANFILNTHFWQHGWINDRSNSRYVRAAQVNQQQHQQIDQLLASLQVLQYRKETIL